VILLSVTAGAGLLHAQKTPAYDARTNPFMSAAPASAQRAGAGDTVGARGDSAAGAKDSVAYDEHASSGMTAAAVNPDEARVPVWYPIVVWQKRINDKLSAGLSSLRYEASFFQVFLIFIISLGYSLLHTAGPGHGKLILSTFFLTSDERRKRSDAALAGAIVSLTHIGTAFVLSLIIYLLLNTLSMSTQRDMATMSKRIGGILVMITGTAIFATTVFNDRLSRLGRRVARQRFRNISLVGISILSGIVPCPLAWFVLIFSISYGIYVYGIISIVGMAIGAAITVGTTGYLVLYAKHKAFSFMKNGITEKVAVYVRGTGGVVLVLLGIIMVRSV
jgi:ABC-type nickel/cobalt efflux system permease component RcnA